MLQRWVFKKQRDRGGEITGRKKFRCKKNLKAFFLSKTAHKFGLSYQCNVSEAVSTNIFPLNFEIKHVLLFPVCYLCVFHCLTCVISLCSTRIQCCATNLLLVFLCTTVIVLLTTRDRCCALFR